jgi:hypothetical protein
MNVVDLPRPTPRSAYDEATILYAEAVKHRADAIYRVGNVRFPGLSDLDLLVVVGKAREDNRYYFSPSYRLPERLQRIFLHEPLIVPASMPNILRYTSHRDAQLVSGEDILNGSLVVDCEEERWCRLLESACSYVSFAERTRERQYLSGRWAIATTSALRFFLADVDAVTGTAFAPSYAQQHDELRAHAFDGGDPTRAILQAWQLFSDVLQASGETLARALGIRYERVVEFAVAALSGQRALPVPASYVEERSKAIAAYHDELAKLRLPFGFLFFVAAYPNAVRPLALSKFTKYVSRNVYRVQRRLGEFVHG